MEKSSENIMWYVKWLWTVAKGARRYVLICVGIGILRICATLAFVWSSKELIDIATGVSDLRLRYPSLILAGCMVLQTALSVVNSKMYTATETRLKNRLRSNLFTTVMESRWAGREEMHTGDVLNRLEDDVRIISELICRTIPSVAVTGLQAVAAAIFLAVFDWRLTIALIVIMPVALMLSRGYARKMKRLTREIRDTDSQVQSHLQENIQHRTLIATMERVGDVSDELDGLQTNLHQQVMRRTHYALFSRTMIQIGFAGGYLLVFLWSVYRLKHGMITFGAMTAFLQLVNQIQRPVVDLSRLLPSLIHSAASIERLAELWDLPSETKGRPVKLRRMTGVRMSGVTFAYKDDGRTVVSDFSHDFQPGSVTAVMGATGVGKSTIIRLILALVSPDKGKIEFYDGDTVAEASPMTRCNVIYVPQGNTLVSGTIRSNLLLGRPDATERQMREALHTAAADFVFDLPDGLDSVCGETGSGISEGQAQRIAIARGLLKSGNVILLDEPTSALDEQTEQTLMERLRTAHADKTFIIVSHSTALAEACTDVVRLEKMR